MRIGLFNLYVTKTMCSSFCIYNYLLYFLIFCMTLLILLCGDVHPNPGTLSWNNILVCHANVRSLCNSDKLIDIKTRLVDAFQIITLSETFLNENTDLNLQFNGYNLFRKDRIGRTGGGVAAYIHENIIVVRKTELEADNIEAMFLELRLPKAVVMLCVIYRPPNESVEFWDKIDVMSDAIRHYKHIIIVGDMNADINSFDGKKLENFCDLNGLHIHNFEPTRITINKKSVLDQVLSNNEALVDDVNILPPVYNSDHCILAFKLKLAINVSKVFTRKVFYYNLTDWDEYRSKLSDVDWEACFVTNDVNKVWESWLTKFLSVIACSIPNNNVTVRPNDKPWYTSDLRKQKRKLEYVHKQAKKKNTQVLWESFRKLRNEYISNCRLSEDVYLQSINEKLHNLELVNSSKWWKLLKNVIRKNGKSGIGTLEHENKVVMDDKDKAELFNTFFGNHSNLDKSNARLPDSPQDVPVQISNIVITEQDALDVLLNLKVNKSSGPDGVSPRMLKEAAPSICSSLTKLINMSLMYGTFPSDWKLAHVVPVFKKGDKKLLNNYRPISLTSCIGKVMERVVFKHLYNYILDNSLLSSFQSGFKPGDSTVYQLLDFYHIISEALDNKKDVRAVFFDISKAFDKVWHEGLIFKLQQFGIGGNLLNWFQDYLNERKQKVVINNVSSSVIGINAGVPQGSVLGPLMFLIYINDITSVVSSPIRLFADDTTIFLTVDKSGENITANRLNDDLRKIEDWANQWLVTFSPPKSKTMTFTRKVNEVDHPDLIFCNSVLQSVDTHKHLGITLANNLKWDTHIHQICSKAKQIINMMKAVKYKIDRKSLETLYLYFCRPILEYGNIVFINCEQKYVDSLESLQLEAARIVVGAIKGTSHNALYNEIGWETLASRRSHKQLSVFHKIINGESPEYLQNHIPNLVKNINRYNVRNSNNLRLPHCNTDHFQLTFFNSAVPLWNELDLGIRNIESNNIFKKAIKKHDSHCKPWFYYGKRSLNIIHSQLRMKCSQLSAHLYDMHIIEHSTCQCGHPYEDSLHYFFICPLYTQARNKLQNSVNNAYNNIWNLNCLLFGNSDLSTHQNEQIVKAVHDFLIETSRFNNLII